MNTRAIITIVIAVVLMLLVMGVAAAITFGESAARPETWSVEEAWSAPVEGTVNSMRVTELSAPGAQELAIHAGNRVTVYSQDGRQIFDRTFPGGLAASLGDTDGDGTQEILVYYGGPGDSTVAAINAGDGSVDWEAPVPGMGQVARLATVDLEGSGRAGLVAGDLTGRLAAVAGGELLWTRDLAMGELRGLDNIKTPEGELVAAADRSGDVIVFDREGDEAWRFNVPGGLRRLRTEELLGPGRSAALVGGEDGGFYALNGANGELLWTENLGQAISEIRLAELDGDPGARELVIGGTRNGVWAYSRSGERLWAARVGGDKTKINEVAALPAPGSPNDLVAVGDEYGVVTLFSPQGKTLETLTYAPPINRMTAGKVAGADRFIVADASSVRALSATNEGSPLRYAPLLAGLLACGVIGLAAYFIGGMKPAPPVKIRAEELTVEAQRARRIMLLESINEVKAMKADGELPPDVYVERLRDLREQLALAEENLLKLGEPIRAEIISCPNCGGKIELGTDRCDYCGHTVIV